MEEAILNFFVKRFDLDELTRAELEELPRALLMTYEQKAVPKIWSKLPLRLRRDKYLQQFKYCTKHQNSLEETQYDGPPPQIRHCWRCQQSVKHKKPSTRETPQCKNENNPTMSTLSSSFKNCES